MTLTTLIATLAGILAGAGFADLLGGAARKPRRRGALVRAVARLGAAINVRAANGLAARIAAAGLDRPVAEVVALQGGCALLGAVVALPLLPTAPGRLGIALLIGAPLAGYLTPEYVLRRRAKRRARAIEQELPDVLDLLRVAIGAGLAPRRALAEVGRRHPGVLAGELRRAATRAQLGEPLDTTLSHLEARCPSHGVPPFVAALKRAERHGAPLGPTLTALALQTRSERAARKAEQAAKAAPKIQLIVALLLVPAVLLLVAAALIPALAAG